MRASLSLSSFQKQLVNWVKPIQAYDLLNDIESYLEVFRNRSLPKTREEFETRATLLQLFRELEHFIQIKVDFYNRYSDKNSNK